MTDIVDSAELGPEGVRAVCQRALALRAGAAARRADGRRLAALFLNPSLRTRSSLEAAASALGIHPIILSPGRDMWALEFAPDAVMDGLTVEHVDDAVSVLSGFVDLLAVRSFAGLVDPVEDRADTVIEAVRKASSVPVLSLESARWHPLQGLADTATWQSHLGADLTGKRLTLMWAPHPKALPQAVPNQVLLSAALQGMEITLAHPEGMDIDPEVVGRVSGLARAGGGDLRITHDKAEGLTGAQVVVAKSWSGWSGYADRAAEATRRAGLGHWRIDPADMKRTDQAGFMHCLPVRRNVVVHQDVLTGPRSWVYEEAHLRLWTAQALLERLLAP